MTKAKEKKDEPKPTGLELMREPFAARLIKKLPKPTKRQTDEINADYRNGIRCDDCGGWHHPKVVHLDYVGHAALTDRLLDCDPEWNWEPMALSENGLPVISGGMWIKLTVCGVTRLGYGDAVGKTGGNAIKEIIGDALRNAAMRFGAALDLWHKGDLHQDDTEIPKPEEIDAKKPESNQQQTAGGGAVSKACSAIWATTSLAELDAAWAKACGYRDLSKKDAVIKAYDKMKAKFTPKEPDVPEDGSGNPDEIPY